MQQPNPDRILRIATVLNMTGLTRSTLYRKINEGSFPKQIQISAHCTGWRESSVMAWLAEPMGWKAD
jgi:prophage regulatory protein